MGSLVDTQPHAPLKDKWSVNALPHAPVRGRQSPVDTLPHLPHALTHVIGAIYFKFLTACELDSMMCLLYKMMAELWNNFEFVNKLDWQF